MIPIRAAGFCPAAVPDRRNKKAKKISNDLDLIFMDKLRLF
jgi:hypothetical protein